MKKELKCYIDIEYAHTIMFSWSMSSATQVTNTCGIGLFGGENRIKTVKN